MCSNGYHKWKVIDKWTLECTKCGGRVSGR